MKNISVIRWWVTILTLACIYTFVEADAGRARQFVSKRNINRQRISEADPYNRYFRPRPFQSPWSIFAPDTPDPDEVDCQIQVQMTHEVGGRCVRLAGERNMAVCQSGIYLDVFNTECPYILQEKEAAAAAAAAASAQDSGD